MTERLIIEEAGKIIAAWGHCHSCYKYGPLRHSKNQFCQHRPAFAFLNGYKMSDPKPFQIEIAGHPVVEFDECEACGRYGPVAPAHVVDYEQVDGSLVRVTFDAALRMIRQRTALSENFREVLWCADCRSEFPDA